ncbi:MAG: DEAD/DEAH box helicase [Chloroflexi bacterium]|nr:DEAD/DEAH box helicase [Chloroflexota bacterium]
MFEFVDELVSDLKLQVVESIDLPSRRQSRMLMPDAYSEIASIVAPAESSNGRLWKHQSQALRHLAAGRNVVVSTGTASGKSLIFQLHAFHRLLTEPDSKILVLYPLRALASDQLMSWQRRAEAAGLNADDVAYISSNLSQAERERVIQQARIVMMTPDLCHAWLMRIMRNAPVSQFLNELALLILDEAHTYESVFGSNLAFLTRRMLTAKYRLSSQKSRPNQLQIIAATATIAEPAKHLEQITGARFRVIEEKSNGAPQRKRHILHIEGPDGGEDGEKVMSKIIAGICRLKERHRFIAFMDSRQGVERTAEDVDLDDVKPYRSGYEQRDRSEIEQALREGTLHGVVSTSALELGIDIEDMEIGVNLGVPQSRKSFRQRLGRIGRHSPGVFIVVAPPNAFRQFGENLKDYYESSVEASYLYLGNRFIQFAHARCLRHEMEELSVSSSVSPAGAKWPEGFRDILKYARESWPREFDDIAKTGGESPHFNYPLRQLGETKIQLQVGSKTSSREIGDIAHHQAIREAYPGAHYLHNGVRYRVNEWIHGFAEIAILLYPAGKPVPIRPLLRKSVTVDVSRNGIVDGRVKRGKSGIVAEVEVQVNESVEGYRIGGSTHLYRDLRVKNPRMKREQRFFRTTGIAIKIEEEWFKNNAIRSEIANGLYDLLCRGKSISPRDVDMAYRNVLIRGSSAPQHTTDTIVIYDSVYGGLRLTESLFDEIDGYMKQLSRAVEIAGDDAIVSEETLKLLQDWLATLDSNDLGESISVDAPKGWLLVYKPGSVVGMNVYSGIVEREIIQPVYSDPFRLGSMQLNYICKDPSQRGDVRSTISHETVVQSGNDWELVLWNPDTGVFRELDDSE